MTPRRIGARIVAIDGRSVTALGLPIANRLLSGGAVSAGQTVTLGLARNVTVKVIAAAWN